MKNYEWVWLKSDASWEEMCPVSKACWPNQRATLLYYTPYQPNSSSFTTPVKITPSNWSPRVHSSWGGTGSLAMHLTCAILQLALFQFPKYITKNLKTSTPGPSHQWWKFFMGLILTIPKFHFKTSLRAQVMSHKERHWPLNLMTQLNPQHHRIERESWPPLQIVLWPLHGHCGTHAHTISKQTKIRVNAKKKLNNKIHIEI